MYTMKYDMCGAANVLGLMLTVAELALPCASWACWRWQKTPSARTPCSPALASQSLQRHYG